MHENVEQRASKDNQEGKPTQKVRPMLGDEVKAGNRKEGD
jgi:hypothetical protein